MPRVNDSSGLTSYAVPNGKILTSIIAGTALRIELKNADGSDPSRVNPLIIATRTTSSTGAAFKGSYITVPLSIDVQAYFDVLSANTPFRIWIVLIDKGDGTFALGVINCSLAGTLWSLDEFQLISTQTLGGATHAGIIYTSAVTGALSNKAFRILGFVTYSSGLAIPSTYDVLPDVVQMFGLGIKPPGGIIKSPSIYTNVSASIIHGYTYGNSIPQISGGDPLFSLPLVPQSPVNWIEHDVFVQGSAIGHAVRVILALFQDANANAIFATASQFDAAEFGQMTASIRTQAGNTSTGFSVRAGCDLTFYALSTFNSNYIGGPTAFGGVCYSGYALKEYMG